MSFPNDGGRLPQPRLTRRGALSLATGSLVAGLGLLPAGRALAQAATAIAPAAAAGNALLTTPKLAPALYEVVVSATIDRVLVASAGTREGGAAIIALDPRTLAVMGKMDLAEGVFGLGLNDRTGILYGTQTRSGGVAAIDIRTGQVVATPKQGEGAHLRQVVVDEGGNRAFATVFGAREAPSAIWIIDGNGQRLAQVITEGLEGGITGLAFDAARNRLFATALTSNEIVEIDLATNKAVRRFASGGEGTVNVALDAEGGRLFVTNQRSNTLTVLNATTGALIRSVPVGEGALGVTFDAARKRLFTANRRAGTVTVLNAETLEVTATHETGTHPNTVALDRRNGNAYVTNKARGGPRGAPPPEDPRGDTVSLIRA